MVRIASTMMLLLSIALGAQAATFCQCLYADGSHCCVDENAPAGCTAVCLNARLIGNPTPCNAGGKYSKVSAWNAQFRDACV
ncbi:hypothetical protein F53441_6372 [Fusarium austroafricanum]|uniref:Extracellular membrane protein CFEM domain-containing protein n=1 Tax=Fusarium austroafricanum TaxID=2364996 RepID=A0A8H4KFZ5_9HYPO|nr:hypothetical protein F53441_6372 [Fusarium austroafricanum]